MASATFDGNKTPRVTVTSEADFETGQDSYEAEITILGVAPARGTTAEERAAGIVQLTLPITVRARGVPELIDVAKRAASTAVYLTPGAELDFVGLVMTEYLTARSVRGALRALDEDLV